MGAIPPGRARSGTAQQRNLKIYEALAQAITSGRAPGPEGTGSNWPGPLPLAATVTADPAPLPH